MRRPTTRLAAGLLVLSMVLGACGDDDEPSADPTTTAAPTTATTESPDATGTTQPDAGEGSCPDEAPIPDDATDVQEAAVDYDGDGDGSPDTLSVFRHDDLWWVQVAWATGGSAAVTIDEASDMGARPLGGYDVDGSGQDEAFVAVGGPAAGSIVAVFRTNGCGIWPVLDADSGMPFSFPVTASIGSFSGATCDGIGDLDLFTGELVDVDEGEYLVAQQPYTLSDGEMEAQPGDAGSIDMDSVHEYSTLDCGLLASAW